ncbi:MAG: ABC transporter ATP-binding protein [archaeon]
MVQELPKINWKDNAEYYYWIAKPYWKWFGLIIFLIFIQTLIEVGHNYLFKLVIDYGTDLVSNKIGADFFVSFIFLLGIVYLVSVIVLSFVKFYRMCWLNFMEVKMMLDIKRDIFNHLIGLSHNFHTTHRTGSLISKLIRSSKSVEGITDFLTFHGSPLIIKVLISFAVIAFFDFYSGLIVLFASIIFIAYCFYILERQQRANLERNDAEDYEKAFISDTFTNIETVKHFGKEKRMSSLFSGIANTTLDKYLKFWNYYSWIDAVFVLIFGLGTILLMYFTLSRTMAGELSIGSLVFIYTSYTALVFPLFEFMWGVRRVYESMSDLQAIVDYKKIKREVQDDSNAKNIKIRKGSVEFRNVSFTYGRREVLKEFNLKINPDEKVALVGHSGAGKTTVIKLLYRLYDPKKGVVLVDGVDVKRVKQDSLRSELSIVPQECVLFNDTIYNNVLFSNPGASREQVFDALRIAKLYDFVISLPEKENTVVGERGIKLSGGEKQRLSIARAVLANKKILVLDEATSSLDSATEREIQEELFGLMKGKTTLIIAHRLSTIMRADKIIVMEKGKIIQMGTHRELSKKSGLYKTLWELQRRKAIK